MKKLIIEGKHELSGTIKIGGAKNSVVALIPAFSIIFIIIIWSIKNYRN